MKIEKVPTDIAVLPDYMIIDKFNEIIDLLAEKYPEDFKETLNPLPCPFCGGRNLEVLTSAELCDSGRDDEFTVCCSYNSGGCGATSGYCKTKREAIEKWNRRAGK